MGFSKDSGRQEVVSAEVDFTFADFGASGVAEAAIELPAGAVVMSGALVIDTAFDSGTSDTLTVGDTDSDARYKSAIDGTAAALTSLVATGLEYTTSKQVVVKWTGVGAVPTAGAGRLFVNYVVKGRTRFSQG